MTAAQAADALRMAEFEGRFSWDESTEPPGAVLSQNPAPGEPDPEPRVVRVSVSSGTPFSPDEALDSTWQDAFPPGRSITAEGDPGSIGGRCSVLGEVPSEDVTSDGLVVEQYVSPSGVGGGTLFVNVRLATASSARAAESLLSAERQAQSACASSGGGGGYQVLPGAGALSSTTDYSAVTVTGYPALRTDAFFAAASPAFGGGVSTMFKLDVAWREGRYVVSVSRAEIFGQTLPPRANEVPGDLEQAVQTIQASLGTELVRSQDNARALSAAKQDLRRAQADRTPGASNPSASGPSSGNSSGRPVACTAIEKTNMSELTATGLTCVEARRLARISWMRGDPDGYSCKHEMQGESSHTVCRSPSGSFGYWSVI